MTSDQRFCADDLWGVTGDPRVGDLWAASRERP
jgi:hypothetical protein